MKAYRRLVKGKVQFEARTIFSDEIIQDTIKKYPSHKEDIELFSYGIRRSVLIGSSLVVCITLLGAVLMWYR